MKYRPHYPPLTGDRLTGLKTHIRGCLAALDHYGFVCQEDRRRALCRWQNLQDRIDAEAYHEALRRLDQPPPAPVVLEFRRRPGPALPTLAPVQAILVQLTADSPGHVLSYFEAVWRRRRQADEEEAAWWDR